MFLFIGMCYTVTPFLWYNPLFKLNSPFSFSLVLYYTYYLPLLHYQHQQTGLVPTEIQETLCPQVQTLLFFLPSPLFLLSYFFLSTGIFVSIVLSSHFRPDPSEALHCVVASTLTEVYPATRKGGRTIEGEQKERREVEEQEEGQRVVGWLQAGRGISIWTRSSVVSISEPRCSETIEEGVWNTKEGEGWLKSNTQPISDYWHGGASDVHWGLNGKMDFFKKLLNT